MMTEREPVDGLDSVDRLREPLAHLDDSLRPHSLRDHLYEVAVGAQRFAARFGAGELSYLVGLWHDLGKYSGGFQRMIREEHNVEAHIEGDVSGPRDHSTAGAIHIYEKLRPVGLLLAFAIAGHHAGMPDRKDLEERLKQADKRKLYADVLARAESAIREHSLTAARPPMLTGPAGKRLLEMWTRLVFSALCDADFLDTERFFKQENAALRGVEHSVADLCSVLDQHLTDVEQRVEVSEVNRVRAAVRAACIAKAKEKPGVFSLTVPTGGGKTLAGLSFALHHAKQNELSRVIVAIPFTSIIEQTADSYRRVFAALGDDVLIEHHSSLDPQKETAKNRIASENWDAPLVVTTTVQLFESLFSNRPGACRKLHRLARSVIILDEAQSLPIGMLRPILDGLSTLVEHFGVTVVFSTATQPTFQKGQLEAQAGEVPGFTAVQEIVPDSVRAFDRLRRVQVCWPSDDVPVTWESLAQEIAAEQDVLAVVHKRRDARELCTVLDELLREECTLHLSALMCPAHRSSVLAEVKRRKQKRTPVRLISTQLVEAGVDLDFAVVYRALAGLDSLAQAAGRCNREGRLPELGQLRVFHAPTKPPMGVLTSALSITKTMLKGGPIDLNDPGVFRLFFRRLYGNAPSLDEKEIQELRAQLCFRQVAEKFRLIEDSWSAPLVIPYSDSDDGQDKDRVPSLLQELATFGPSRQRLRSLQRYTVTVPAKDREIWLAQGFAESVADTVVALKPAYQAAYHQRFGLCPDRVGIRSAEFLVG
jgi:CRISPR-associated endonuclease/helicase Cas3